MQLVEMFENALFDNIVMNKYLNNCRLRVGKNFKHEMLHMLYALGAERQVSGARG